MLSCSLPFLLLCPLLTVSHEVALGINSFSLASLVSMAAWGQTGLVLSPWSIRWTSPPDCDSLKGTVVYGPLVGPARGNYTSDSLAFAVSPCLGIFILSTGLKIFFLFCIEELAVSERVGFLAVKELNGRNIQSVLPSWHFTQLFCSYSIQFNKELHSH